MMKKTGFLTLLLIFCVCCLAPKVFAQATDEDLSRAILFVKNTISIPNDFTDFNITSNDYGTSKKWNLTWHSTSNDVSVCVTSNNTILSYYCYESLDKVNSSFEFTPMLTKEKYETCLDSATKFLNKVLRDNENFYFYNLPKTFPTSSYNPMFNGAIKVDGVDSIFDFNIIINLQTGSVISFFRDEFLGMNNDAIPSNIPDVSSIDARAMFINELPVKDLEYIIDPNNPEGRKAKLVYTIPDYHLYYINAHDGQLSNYNNYYPMNRDNVTDEAYLSAKPKANLSNSLTEIELDAIDKINDVLSTEELDLILRSQEELGLSKYTISQSSYYKDTVSKNFFCSITYTADDDLESLGITESKDKDTTISKSITVNAKTGEILSLYTSYPYGNFIVPDTMQVETNYHTDFLKRAKNHLFKKAKLVNSYKNYFGYVQVENNYLFRKNYFDVRVNEYTGIVDGFSQNWDDAITFEKPSSIITPEVATKVMYDNSYAKLYYITEIFSKKETLLLAYLLEYPRASGICAKDGSILTPNVTIKEKITYTDVDDCYAKDRLLLLGEHGVGFDHTGVFDANAEVTQLDALILFANSLGYSFNTNKISLQDFKTIYNVAYTYNIITAAEKEPLRPVSRCEFVRMLLAYQYSYINNLKNPKNILRCGFVDCSDIADEYFTYVCIAYGLGLVVGDGQNNFYPKDTITRLDACNILYNFMQMNTIK